VIEVKSFKRKTVIGAQSGSASSHLFVPSVARIYLMWQSLTYTIAWVKSYTIIF